MAAHVPPGKEHFGDLDVKLYITAASLNTCTLYLYGDDPDALLLDAVLASAAIPAVFPPIEHDGGQYVDGGVVANVPIEIAIEKGATTIYAIHLGYAGVVTPEVHGLLPILGQTINAMMYQHLLDDIEAAHETPGVTLHLIPISTFTEVPLWDFSRAAEMIEEGRRVTEEYLQDPQPTMVMREVTAMQTAPPPPGAAVYVPKRRRGE